MSEQLPDWVMDLVAEVIEFEEDHPKLYEAGETVNYQKPLAGQGMPGYEQEKGTLVGRVWCLADVFAAIPKDIKLAAYWYQRGRERGMLDEQQPSVGRVPEVPELLAGSAREER